MQLPYHYMQVKLILSGGWMNHPFYCFYHCFPIHSFVVSFANNTFLHMPFQQHNREFFRSQKTEKHVFSFFQIINQNQEKCTHKNKPRLRERHNQLKRNELCACFYSKSDCNADGKMNFLRFSSYCSVFSVLILTFLSTLRPFRLLILHAKATTARFTSRNLRFYVNSEWKQPNWRKIWILNREMNAKIRCTFQFRRKTIKQSSKNTNQHFSNN